MAFYFSEFYPKGGANDLQKSFDTFEKAVEYIEKVPDQKTDLSYSIQIYDCEEGKVVFDKYIDGCE